MSKFMTSKEKKAKQRHQIKSRWYYIFWGTATVTVFVGQVFVGNGFGRMSDSFVKNMNKAMNPKLKDWSDNLVGKVKQELKFDHTIEKLWLDECSHFIGRFHNYVEYRHSFGRDKLDTENNNYGIQIASGWFVRQFENEYNPLHIHTGSRMSCVGYLALPKGIDKEWEEDYKDHHPANGHIQFAHVTPSG